MPICFLQARKNLSVVPHSLWEVLISVHFATQWPSKSKIWEGGLLRGFAKRRPAARGATQSLWADGLRPTCQFTAPWPMGHLKAGRAWQPNSQFMVQAYFIRPLQDVGYYKSHTLEKEIKSPSGNVITRLPTTGCH